MTSSPGEHAASSDSPGSALAYSPGVCNIGSAEIARRRRAGHVGLVATLALLVGLLTFRAPWPARFLVALPATAAASGYLQARLRFCAGFGARGVYNFGAPGRTLEVEDDEARARDRARATQIGVTSAVIGTCVGLLAALLPGRLTVVRGMR